MEFISMGHIRKEKSHSNLNTKFNIDNHEL